MNLLLQLEQKKELKQELFKIEQYVEMVLQYLRLESISSDFKFEEYNLSYIIKQVVKSYSTVFIYKKIKIEIEKMDISILTDIKWLTFALEQILSNALKYTYSNNIISIFLLAPNILVIEDGGIGIETEDIPRIFEKGFTGYNGRMNKKSSGIGLFLCKEILDKLSHKITITSIVGKGTKVMIDFTIEKVDFD